jgi:hypothetical protein
MNSQSGAPKEAPKGFFESVQGELINAYEKGKGEITRQVDAIDPSTVAFTQQFTE